MRRISTLSVILLALLITLNSFASEGIDNIFKLYADKTTALNFEQTSVNAMSGQRITRYGKLTIKAKQSMVFDYKNERVIINDFEAVDYRNGQKTVYKLSGFNKILFLLFLGKEDINGLFDVKKESENKYILTPKYKSSIAEVDVCFDKKGKIKKLTIIDIYSNKTIYKFYAVDSKRTQSGD